LKLLTIVFCVSIGAGLSGCASNLPSETRQAISRSTPSSRPSSKASPAEAKKESVNPFNTEVGRSLALSFFVKPALKPMLNDPDSLQDLEIISATPIKTMPGSFKVTVFYRAKNAFAALVGGRQAFIFTPNPNGSTGPYAWIVSPVKS
jgi:hypothetical protein